MRAVTEQQKPAPRLALTIAEFCRAFGISRPFYYALQKQGRGPVEMRIGHRTLISMEAADRWRQEQEGKST
jgi:predicted DNA-binding transcriptional regulator AlpA